MLMKVSTFLVLVAFALLVTDADGRKKGNGKSKTGGCSKITPLQETYSQMLQDQSQGYFVAMSTNPGRDNCSRVGFEITKNGGDGYPENENAVWSDPPKEENKKIAFTDTGLTGWNIKIGEGESADYKVVYFNQNDGSMCLASCDTTDDTFKEFFCLVNSYDAFKAVQEQVVKNQNKWPFKKNEMPVLTYSRSCMISGKVNDPKYPLDVETEYPGQDPNDFPY